MILSFLERVHISHTVRRAPDSQNRVNHGDSYVVRVVSPHGTYKDVE